MKKLKRALSALPVLLFMTFPEYFVFGFFAVADEFGSDAHKVIWNVLDDEYDSKEIELNFWTPVSSSRVEEAKRTVTMGKTKRVRLPNRMYFELDYSSAKDEDFYVFVPEESCWHENKETGKREKRPHEIVIFAKPALTEDEECFRISSAVKNASCSLCYYDFALYQFVWIDSSDGVFFKKDKYVRDKNKRDFRYPEKDEIALRFLVKSSQYEDESYYVPVVYKRGELIDVIRAICAVMEDVFSEGRKMANNYRVIDEAVWERVRSVSVYNAGA